MQATGSKEVFLFRFYLPSKEYVGDKFAIVVLRQTNVSSHLLIHVSDVGGIITVYAAFIH